jgi:GalNAc-alpha-(1->4)-GalNAc-alpha-(1->3)-diNAcBac-PP-undecaprenol alpha-1,4-N-acetyl-D-galactosaminyltransferase
MPKHLLIINNGLAAGGIERASVSIANYFASIGFRISVIALYQSEKIFKLNEGISFHEPKFSRQNLNKYYYLFKLMLFIRKTTYKINPDSILSFSEWTNSFVVVSLLASKYPVFVTDRMSPLAKLPFITELLRSLFYKKASGIIAQSNFAKQVLEKKTNANNILVIYNPVNVIYRVECISKNRIVSVGRLEEVKGHKYLIQAFAMIDKLDWELSIVGEGSQRINLYNLACSLGIENRVIFHGHLDNFDLQLSESKIFVLPSLKEGFPNSLIEAMSLPLPCIASDTFNGKNEIITHGENGLLVEPGNVNELVKAMNMLINNEVMRNKLAFNAFKIRDKLKFETIANQYLQFVLNI